MRRLREGTNAWVPGQYTEHDAQPPPGMAAFVHPTIPYDPDLPPAAFPTLKLSRATSQPAQSRAASNSSLSVSRRDMTESVPLKKATVFDDTRISPEDSPLMEGSRSPDLVFHDAPQRVSEMRQGPDRCRCGSFEHLSNGRLKEMCLAQGWEAYEVSLEWNKISDGLKLIIVSELSKGGRCFEEIMELLALPSACRDEFIEVHNQEILRRGREKEKIAKSQTVQLKALMSSGCSSGRDVFTTPLERDLYANLEEPATFIIRKDDIQRATSLLIELNVFHLAFALRYFEGVAQFPNILYGPAADTPPPRETVVRDENLEARSGEMSKENAVRLTSKRLPQGPRDSDDPKRTKRSLPSGLRTAISWDDPEESIAIKPAALQVSMKHPIPPSRFPTRGRERAKPTMTYFRRQTKDQSKDQTKASASMTADSHMVTVAQGTLRLVESHSDQLPTQGGGLGENLPPTQFADQTPTKSTLTAAVRDRDSKIIILKLKSAEELQGRTAKMMKRMEDASNQISEESQGADDWKESPIINLTPKVMNESQTVAGQASDVRNNEVMRQTDRKATQIPAFLCFPINLPWFIRTPLPPEEQEDATDNEDGDGKENEKTMVVRNTRSRKRTRQHDYDDDADL